MSPTPPAASTPLGRPSKDEVGLLVASAWRLRGTCGRRKVGCHLVDADGFTLSTGYNGVAKDASHCTITPCPGRHHKSGEGLDDCEALHAEWNALIRCKDPRLIHTCYTTSAPCITCTKMLLGTSCKRIVFIEDYPHSVESRRRWLGLDVDRGFKPPVDREWIQYSPDYMIRFLDPR